MGFGGTEILIQEIAQVCYTVEWCGGETDYKSLELK